MIRQNRAVPILLVLTVAFVLYLGGCFGSEEPETATLETATPVPTMTAAPVVSPSIDIETQEDPFYHTVEPGDLLASIASKYNVTPDVIIRANPQMNPSVIIVGEELLIPGAGTDNTVVESDGPDRPDGVTVEYLIEPGDTFGAIAAAYTVSLDALVEANPEVDPANLQVNQLITIPPWGTGIDASELQPRVTPVASTRQPGDPPLEHEVVAGDFLAAIAEAYNVTTAQIIEANGLEDGGNNIQVGDVLLIPPPEREP